MKLVRRSDMDGDGPRREDLVEVFVRFVRTPSGGWVAEADAPPVRAEADSLPETRRILAIKLALRMGAAALERASLIVDIPEDAADEDEDAAESLGDDDEP